MYDIKRTISKMKKIAKVSSNAELARVLDVSYNTFNTWLKRSKLPQEVLISFCKRFDCSLDYLILDKNINTKQNNTNEKTPQDSIYTYRYYGKLFGIENSSFIDLTINKSLMHTDANYLLNINDIYFVAFVSFDIFNNIAKVKYNNKEKDLSISEFKEINRGLITEYIIEFDE